MIREKIKVALDTEFDSMDLGRVTARSYLKQLLTELLLKGESFSGKRPFGNSGWEHELAMPLHKAGVIEATVDEEQYAYPVDESDYEKALQALVEEL